MSMFAVTARDSSGVRREIRREAESATALAAALRSEGLLVISVEKVRGEGELPRAWHPAWLLPMTGFDVEMGLRQTSSMLKSGVSLIETLRTASEQARNPRSARAWQEVRAAVLSGSSLSDAMAMRVRRFGEMTVRLARVGEQSGEMDLALSRAADHLETRRNLRTAVVNALVYPVIAVLMAVGVSAFLVVAVIPKVAAFLQSGGSRLPPITQALVDLSDWLTANCWTVLGGLALVVGLWFAVRCFRFGRECEDAFLLRVPVSGRILRIAGTAVLARSLQTMLSSGVPLIDSLEVAGKLLANRRLRRRLEKVRVDVLNGESLSVALGAVPELLPMLGRMSAVGEMTGALAETFGETARFHELLLAVAIKRFSVLIEPVMICVTGLIVGFVYIAFFTAVFSMANAG